jgi:hypothetical protein
MMPNRIEQVKAHGVARVARAFGFTVAPDPTTGRPPQWLSPCPSCGEATRHHKTKDRRGAVGPTRDGGGWRCFQCDASGDAFGFAAWAVLKRAPRRGEAREVLEVCAGLGLCDGADGKAAARSVARRTPSVPPTEPPRLERPPEGELAALWEACYRLDAVPSNLDPRWTGEARAYLGGRGLDVGVLASMELCRILPPPSVITWPRWWPHRSKVRRLAMPMFDANGAMASMQARAIVDATPKDMNARGFSVAELVFACPLGRAFLAGDCRDLEAVITVEGLTDVLKVASRVYLSGRRRAVLGVVSGSAPLVGRVDWPPGVPCWVGTDDDDQGEKYAAQIVAHLPEHVRCERITWGGEVAS